MTPQVIALKEEEETLAGKDPVLRFLPAWMQSQGVV